MNIYQAVGQRIKDLRKSKKFTQDVLGDKVGTTGASISRIESGGSTLLEVYAAIAQALGVNLIDILITEDEKGIQRAPMQKAANDRPHFELERNELQINGNAELVRAAERITFVPVRAQAGYLANYNDPEYIEQLPAFSLAVLGLTDGPYKAFQIWGDSMVKRLMPGDVAICKTTEKRERLRPGEIYAWQTIDEGITVKRLAKETGRSFWLQSDNNIYDPFEVLKSDLQQLHWMKCSISFGISPLVDAERMMQQFEAHLMRQAEERG